MRSPLRNRWVPIALVGVLVVVLAFEVVALADDRGAPDAPDAAREVARDFAVALTSYSHDRVDADIKKVLAFATGSAERDLKARLGNDFVRDVERDKRVSVGRVLHGPTLQRVAGDRAAFLVVVAQQTTADGNDSPPEAETHSLLIEVTTGKSPKVAHVEVL